MTLPHDFEQDRDNGIKIRADRMMTQFNDVKDALTASIAKDGQTTPTANLPMGGFKHTGAAVASIRTDYLRASQAQDNDLITFTATGTDTYAITPSPAVTSYTTGQGWLVIFTNANTGAATLNVSGLGAKAITKNGTTALAAGDIAAGQAVFVAYDGTRFQIIAHLAYSLGLNAGSNQTTSFTAASNTKYVCNFSAAATITLPASPTTGDLIEFTIGGGQLVTLDPNGNKINASTSTLPLGTQRMTLLIGYTGSTDGWV
jgi:hypothetical protein